MQRLGIAERLFGQVESGEKRSTIRWRETRIAPGLMEYICDGDAQRRLVVKVVRCTDMPLSEAAAFVGKADLWPKPVMLAGMREHYPEIEWHDTVQVIEHLSPSETAASER